MYIRRDTTKLSQELGHYQGMLDEFMQRTNFLEHQVALTRAWEVTQWESPTAWLRAVLDLKIVEGSSAEVIDWKTGKIYPDHEDQKELYSLTTFAEHPEVKEVKATHVYVDLRKNTQKTYARDNAEAMQERWNRRVGVMQLDTEFIPNPNYGCRWCPYSKANGGPCRF
jgi:hypothetical protein